MNDSSPSALTLLATYIDHLASAIRANASSGLPEDKPGMERAARLLDLHKTRVLEGDEHTWLAPVLDALSDAAADRAAVEGAYGLASRWAVLRTYGSAATELRNVLVKTEPQISHAERREQLAGGIYEFWNPGLRWEDAHADDVTCYRVDADAAMIAADALAGRGAAARTAADIYLEVASRLTAFGEKPTPEWAPYCVQAGVQVQEWAAQLVAADAGRSSPEPATDLAGETQQDETAPVKESTRRYAEELRSNPGAASADGHAGWECEAGASLLVEAETSRPGRVATHHGVIYACARHRDASVERITGAGYEVDPRPAPPSHRHNPWPCGHVTAYDTKALAALTGTAPTTEA